ncbi:hypothetical protein GW7_17726 [Heterocephalus glaber]|uniref:Uncharacterized protein n=1 Tax=Heterocephalus glaber TaxID=10181 RepID=G5AMD8_HETGA|nr:hypothetical protein GW7_17726 [Heterocephalus glaber]
MEISQSGMIDPVTDTMSRYLENPSCQGSVGLDLCFSSPESVSTPPCVRHAGPQPELAKDLFVIHMAVGGPKLPFFSFLEPKRDSSERNAWLKRSRTSLKA